MPSQYICTSSLSIAFAVNVRVLFIPVIFLAVQLLAHPLIISLLMGFLGLTNGSVNDSFPLDYYFPRYLTLCCFALGQKTMRTAEESFLAGNILIISLIFGLNLGSFGSIGWAKLDN